MKFQAPITRKERNLVCENPFYRNEVDISQLCNIWHTYAHGHWKPRFVMMLILSKFMVLIFRFFILRKYFREFNPMFLIATIKSVRLLRINKCWQFALLHNLPDLSLNRPDAGCMGLIPAYFWHVMACWQGRDESCRRLIIQWRVNECSPGHRKAQASSLSPSGALRPKYFVRSRSMSWLMMPWLRASPGHQQPWHCLFRINGSFVSISISTSQNDKNASAISFSST